jgi:hypothetical protein
MNSQHKPRRESAPCGVFPCVTDIITKILEKNKKNIKKSQHFPLLRDIKDRKKKQRAAERLDRRGERK